VGRKPDKIMATRKRHSPEQIVRKLMKADRLLAEGKDTAWHPGAALPLDLGRARRANILCRSTVDANVSL
jgi:hypothetical protein